MSVPSSTERYYQQRERELFLEILDTNPAERSTVLDKACGNDSELRQRVETLLREEGELGGFLEKPVIDTTSIRIPPQSSPGGPASWPRGEQLGDRIDRYKLVEKIGEGGCGVVYLAEQEEPVRRQVALKVIKLGMDTKSVIARFGAERQALALMDHVNIARILDAGATETGRPYFVMELVRGVRITEYCDQAKMPVQARLRLFINLCQAVQHAHQKGIIHRDLKPSNVLVTLQDGQPVPKIIDFGIAKATELRLGDHTITLHHAFMGTPAYVSPEQAEMSEINIDTRSDIYSLGALLYELLTGRPPFDPATLRRVGWDEFRRIIREQEPPQPSTHLASLTKEELAMRAGLRSTTGAKLVHGLRGDLDCIAGKCLEKDGNRRYQTAHDLALDLQRHLQNEAIMARPPSAIYRFQKQFHRNRKTYAAVALVVLALVLGTALSAWQAIRARKAESQAVQARLQEVKLRQQAERQKEAAQLNEYVASINLAHKALLDGNLGRSIQLLDKLRPQAGEPDRRGFEWRYLWQLTHGDDHYTFPTQPGSVEALAVSRQGDLLAVSTRMETTLWNITSQSLEWRLPQGATSLAFSPDGRRLAGVSSSGVRVWNTLDGTELVALRNMGRMPALSPDGSILAAEMGGSFQSGSGKGIRVLDTRTGEDLSFLADASTPLAISPDGRTLASFTRSGVTLWPVDGAGDPLILQNSTQQPGPYFQLVFSPDGKIVAAPRNNPSGRGGYGIDLWDAQTGQKLPSLPENSAPSDHVGVIRDLAFSPDGRFLATASWDYSVRLWHIAARQCLHVFQGHLNEVWAVAFTPDGNSLVSGGKDGSVYLWPLNQPHSTNTVASSLEPLAFSTDGRRLAAVESSGALILLDPASLKVTQSFPLGSPRFSSPSLSLSRDFKVLAFSSNGHVKIGSPEALNFTELPVQGREMNFISLSPDGSMLLAGGPHLPIQWWKLRPDPQLVQTLPVQLAVFSPDGKSLAAVRDREVQLWDVDTQSPRLQVTLSSSPACVAFSMDGQVLATTDNPMSVGNSISLWDTANGALIGVCSGHKQTVWSVAFAPGHKTLASASHDGTVKLWHVGTQQELLTLRLTEEPVRGLLFSPDGSSLVMSSARPGPNRNLLFLRAPLAGLSQ